MIRTAWKLAVAAAGVVLSSAAFDAVAQQPDGYLYSAPAGMTARNSFGQCWRAAYWTPAMATQECDPDLLPNPERPAASPKAVH